MTVRWHNDLKSFCGVFYHKFSKARRPHWTSARIEIRRGPATGRWMGFTFDGNPSLRISNTRKYAFIGASDIIIPF